MSGIITGYSAEESEYKYFSEVSASEFLVNAKIGFINAILEKDEVGTLKRISTYVRFKGKVLFHFSVQTAMVFDSVKAQRFVSMNTRVMEPVVTHNLDFKRLSIEELFEGGIASKDIEGKIVMFGFLGPGNDDKFFSSLNSRVEPLVPDMYGLEFLAQIVEQIIGN